MKRTPVFKRMKPIFWNVDLARLDAIRDADAVSAVVEFGSR
jgi:hypothetical protein